MGTRTRPARQGMPLGAHLRELRKRLTLISISILVASLGGWFVSSFVLDAMRAPLRAVGNQVAQMNYDNVTAAFDLKIQIAVTVGVVASSPIWLFQVWAFLVPALHRRELKYGLGFFLTAVPLFVAGCAAGWLVVPHMVLLLAGFVPHGDAALFTAGDYFGFILKLVVAIGVAFVLPVFLVLLNFVGIVSGRAMLKSWRIAILAIVVFTAIATPSADVVSMFLLAIPMVLLYAAAVIVSILHDRRVSRLLDQPTPFALQEV
jgi:sec-independent protein translocase protein TatC